MLPRVQTTQNGTCSHLKQKSLQFSLH